MDAAKGYAFTQIETGDNKQVRRMALTLAWPAITEMFLATLVQFVDTAMVGSLGQIAIAAVGVSTSPMWFLMGVFSALGVGATALVARFSGARDKRQADQTAQQAFLLGTGLAILMTLLGLLYAEKVPALMGAKPEVIPAAGLYFRLLSTSFVFFFLSTILSGVLRGVGDTKTPMKVNVLANLVNVTGNFLLIFPTRVVTIALPSGFVLFETTIPGAGLGVAGAAIATSFSRAVAGSIILYVLFTGRRGVRLSVRNWKLDGEIIRRIIKVGVPASIERIIISSGQVLFSVVVLSLGTVQYAAHHLAIVAESVSYMPGFGFSMAATTLVGQGLGAGKPKLAELYGYVTTKMGVLVMGMMGILFFFFGRYFMRFFTADPDIIRYGAMVLRLIAFAQIPFAVQMVLTGALRGAGDTVWPLVIGAVGMWGVRMVLVWVMVYQFNWGLAGVWLAMVIDLWVRAIISFLRFRSGKWQQIKI